MRALNLFRNRSVLGLAGALAALAFVPACDGTPIEEPAAPPPPADDTLTAVASLTLATGQVVEVFDLGGRVLLSESGEAGLPAVLDGMGETRADQLVDVWRRLAPDRAVPAAVVSLQDRLMSETDPDLARPPALRIAPEINGFEFDLTPRDTPPGTLAAPVGCNNGCCDYEWLKTFQACSSKGNDYQWFHYNFGWSSVKVYDVLGYDTFACAAIGSTRFVVSVEGGGGGSWVLPERYYRKVQVIAPFCCDDPNVVSKTNTSSAQALHTHCGRAVY